MSVCIQQAFRESKSPTEISVVNQKNSKTNLDQGSEESEKSFARNLKTVIANLIGACCINQLLLQWVWEDQRVPILTNPATWTSNTKSTQNYDDSTLPLFPSWIWNWEHCLLLKLNLSWVKRLQGSERRSCIVWFKLNTCPSLLRANSLGVKLNNPRPKYFTNLAKGKKDPRIDSKLKVWRRSKPKFAPVKHTALIKSIKIQYHQLST